VEVVEPVVGSDAADHLGAGRTIFDFEPVDDEGSAVDERPARRLVLEDTARYGLAGDVVDLLEPHTEADPAALLLDFLASFGNAVGSAPHVIADGAQHPARLSIIPVRQDQSRPQGDCP
jgi:hypothetical protein